MEKTIRLKNSWEAITLKEFEQIEQIANADIPEDYRVVNILSVLTGEPPVFFESLPLHIFITLVPKIAYLYEDAPDVKVKDHYVINGHKYRLDANIPSITTAQYIDYQTYMREENRDLQKIISCFLIPEGHAYNDGYDLSEVLADIHNMLYVDVKAIAFFIKKQSALFILTTKSYLSDQMKKMGIPKKKIEKDLEPLDSGALSLLS